MKLFTKDIDKKLFQQYPIGNDLENQVVVAKIFNPYGRGVWYLLNSDPEDPDYIWAIVDLFEVEVGSVSRSELESIKVPPFNLHLERDLYFSPINAAELYRGLIAGKQYADGGGIETDEEGNELFAKGGMVKYFPKEQAYRYMGSSSIETEVMEKIRGQLSGLKFAGNFNLPTWKSYTDAYLYNIDDYDKKILSGFKLKEDEKFFRYYTRQSAIGGMVLLIKINIEKGLVYFPVYDDAGEEIIGFDTKGTKASYINLVEDFEKFADGGSVSDVEFVDTDKGTFITPDEGNPNRAAILFEDGGKIENIVDEYMERLKSGESIKRYFDVRGIGKKYFETIVPNRKEKGYFKRYESLSKSDIGVLQNEYLDESDVRHYLSKTVKRILGTKKFEDGGETVDWSEVFKPLSEEEIERYSKELKENESAELKQRKDDYKKKIRASGKDWNDAFLKRVKAVKYSIQKFVDAHNMGNSENASNYALYVFEEIEDVKEMGFGAEKYANELEKKFRVLYDKAMVKGQKIEKYKEGGLVGGFEGLEDEMLKQKIEIFLGKMPKQSLSFYYIDKDRNTLFVGFNENFNQREADVVYNAAVSSREFFDADNVDMKFNSETKNTVFEIPVKKKIVYAHGGRIPVDKKYTHFAVRKSDGKIVTGWDYKGVDKEDISSFSKMDLKDMDIEPKTVSILSKSYLIGKGIDPFSWDNWRDPKELYSHGGSTKSKCEKYISGHEAVMDNGYYFDFSTIKNFVDPYAQLPKIDMNFCMVTYNSGGQKDLKVTDTINSMNLVKELSSELDIEKESAMMLLSVYLKKANRFTSIEDLNGKKTIVVDRDKVVCSDFYNDDEEEDDDDDDDDDDEKFEKGGTIKRKMYVGDSVLYKGSLRYISEKNGVIGLKNLSSGAWGMDYPFTPLSRIDVDADVTDMVGRKVEIVTHNKEYADGGSVTKKAKFSDKVKAISASLKGKTVKPKYRKKYGKTYSPTEAKEAAQRIAGAAKAKYEKKKIVPEFKKGGTLDELENIDTNVFID